MNQLLIGADPELFVLKTDGQNFQYVSGHTWKCGTKKEPKRMKVGWSQNDGLALEFNIEPANSKAQFVYRIVKGMEELSSVLDEGCSLRAVPCIYVSKDYLESLPKHVQALGCDPDMHAWKMEWNPVPDATLGMRTGAGHIHLGWTQGEDVKDPEHHIKCARIVRELDYYLGLPSLEWDRDNDRRKLYGGAGAFRPKSYGLEYRVLSNAWLRSRELMGIVYDQARKAFVSAAQGGLMTSRYRVLAWRAIDEGNRKWREQFPELGARIDGDVPHA